MLMVDKVAQTAVTSVTHLRFALTMNLQMLQAILFQHTMDGIVSSERPHICEPFLFQQTTTLVIAGVLSHHYHIPSKIKVMP